MYPKLGDLDFVSDAFYSMIWRGNFHLEIYNYFIIV